MSVEFVNVPDVIDGRDGVMCELSVTIMKLCLQGTVQHLLILEEI